MMVYVGKLQLIITRGYVFNANVQKTLSNLNLTIRFSLSSKLNYCYNTFTDRFSRSLTYYTINVMSSIINSYGNLKGAIDKTSNDIKDSFSCDPFNQFKDFMNGCGQNYTCVSERVSFFDRGVREDCFKF